MSDSGLVHVIDDDEAVRDALAALLRSAGHQVETYPSAVHFLHGLERARPGCVVTDVRMPQMTGLELLRRLQAREATFPVIVLTGEADVPMAVEALKGGAADFIQKPFEDEVILSSIGGALSRLQDGIHRRSEGAAYARRIADLSTRQRQVLEGIVAGRSNKMIAIELGISPRTVEVYRANIMAKMQADSLSELVRMALLAEESA